MLTMVEATSEILSLQTYLFVLIIIIIIIIIFIIIITTTTTTIIVVITIIAISLFILGKKIYLQY